MMTLTPGSSIALIMTRPPRGRGASRYFLSNFWEEEPLDKWRSRNYFFDRKWMKGVKNYGKGINDLETIYGVGPF